MRSTRRIKVGYTTDRRSLQSLSYDGNATIARETARSLPVTTPQLRLRGQWLAEAGFHIGDRLTVAVSQGQLVITKEGGDAES